MTTHDERWRAFCRALDASRPPQRRNRGLPTAAFAQILSQSGDIDTAFAAMVRQLADSEDQPPTAP